MEIFSAFTSLLSMLPELAVVSLCIYYYSQRRSVDGLLMVTGSVLSILISGFYRLFPIINMDLYMEWSAQNLFMVTGVIGFIGSVSFAVGLGMLILEMINKAK
jgi:hypothetical protein